MSSSSHRLAASRPDLSRRRLVVAGLVLALLASLGGLAPIAVDPVRAAGPWHVSPTGGGSNDGSDCANAFAGIQAGVTAAAPGETIRLCDGTYALGAPVTVDKSDLRFEGETTTGTVVDGADATRLFDASGRNVTFFGLTLTNGSVTGRGGAVIATNVTLVGVDATSNTASGSGTDGFGGAVYGVSGVSVSGGSYTDNVASGNGGAIATGGALSITSGEFIGNRAIGRGGGAVFSGVSTTIVDGTFIDNTSNTYGGAVDANGVTLVGGLFRDNVTGAGALEATWGGGAVFSYAYAMNVTGTVFEGNISQGKPGGAIGTTNLVGAVSLTNTVFTDNSSATYGGAVWAAGAMLSVSDATFVGNAATRGGAIFAQGTVATTDGSFTDNRAVSGEGGAIFVNGPITVLRTEFSSNTAFAGGGAIRAESTAVIVGAAFTDNSGSEGGAVQAVSPSVADSTFVANRATYTGGAVWSSGTVSISDSTFVDNAVALQRGGAVFKDGAGALAVTGSTFAGNTAGTGGAISRVGSGPGATIAVANSTFVANQATGLYGAGGAIEAYSSASGLRVEVTNATFVDNTAGTGDHVSVDGPDLTGTLSSTDTIYAGGDCVVDQTSVTGTNLATHPSCPNDGTTVTSGDLNLGALADNGGPTETIALLTGSVAIDATVATGGACPTATDQRGRPRPYSGTDCDAGAFEFDPSLFVLPTSAPTWTYCPSPYATVEAAVVAADPGEVVHLCAGVHDLTAGVTVGVTDLVIEGDGSADTFVDGQGAYRLFDASGQDLAIRDLTLRDGSTGTNGGAVIADDLELTRVRVEGNHADGDGGAIRTTASLVVTDSRFTGNAAGGEGGAISAGCEVAVTGSDFSSNTAGGGGGAISALNDCAGEIALSISGGDFSSNTAGGGGGAIDGNLLFGYTVSGTTFNDNSAGTYGGALRCFICLGGMSVEEARFTGNRATESGGAIVAALMGDVHVTNSDFTANTAGSHGGAIASDGDVSSDPSSYVENRADRDGGAIWASGTVTTIGDEFLSNSTSTGDGGAIYAGGEVTVSDGTFIGNDAADGAGGAIYGGGEVYVTAATFTWNTAHFNGGAIHADTAVSVTEGQFVENTAATEYGGAIFLADGPVTLVRSTFAGNRGYDYGGAVAGYGSSTIDATNSTFVGNHAAGSSSGGALYAPGDISLAYSTFVDNTVEFPAYSSGDAILSDANGTLDHVLIVGSGSTAVDCKFSAVTDVGGSVETGTSCLGASPSGPGSASGVTRASVKLGTFEARGERTWTYSLSDGSVAIDVDAAETCLVATDQRGSDRPEGDGCDAGAYEATPTGGPGAYIVGVGTQGCGAYATIRAAAKAALDGETVHVCAGIHTLKRPITISGKDLTFEATSGTTTIVDGGGTSQLFSSDADLTFRDLRLRNAYTTGDGGAVRGAAVTVLRSVFSDNTAASGGAIYASGPVDVSSATFSGNDAALVGGAICTSDASAVTVVASRFTRNAATYYGGAIKLGCAGLSGPIAIDRSTFDANIGGRGGAIAGSETAARARNSTFVENTAGVAEGGALFVSTFEVTNGTFVRNISVISDYGGHVYAPAGMAADDSIFTGGTSFACFAYPITGTGSFTSDPECPGTVTDGTALNLGSFQDSGSSWVIPLRSPSVAIDSTAPVSGACLSATDQRGVSRPVSIGCDAGAYEVGPSVVLAYTGPSLVYAGSGSTANVMLSGTTYPAVAGCDLEFEVTRIDPAGGPWTYDATSGTKGTGSAIAYGLTVGTYEVIVRAVGDCAGIPDASGAVVVAPSTIGKGTAGGGSYRVDPFSGRVKFAHVVQVRTVSSKVGRTTVYTTTTKGSLLWTFKNEWRLKANFSYSATDGSSTYGLTTCTTGDFVGGALPPSFTSGRCGRFSGAALLQVYDPIAGEWAASTYTNVRFVATVFDGGTKSVCTKNRCTTTDYPDWFGIRIWADNVPLGPATPLIPTSLLSSLASPNGNGSLRAN